MPKTPLSPNRDPSSQSQNVPIAGSWAVMKPWACRAFVDA